MKKSILWLAVLLWASQLALYGQGGAYGSIVGTVTDTSGAIMPGVAVTITNIGTNTSITAHTTSGEGSYSVPYLTPGLYRVAVEFQGFAKSTVENIRLAVDQIARADFQLTPGMLTQTVTVSAHTLGINTENSTVGTVISQRQTEDLPLNGRNFTQLMLLGPGVVQTDGEQSTRPNSGDAFSIAGSRPSSNQYLLDGVTNNDTTYQTPAIVPSIDAIEEFKEQTKTYSAAYGTSANQININIKSGTNQLHGTVFDFLRNNSLDSRNFYDAGITPLRRNQFGFTVGGPIYIPKVYDGRNRTFFFADYEGLRLRESGTSYLTVPTMAERQGIFTTPIVNPETGENFPGNQIPQSSFSRLANVILPTIPAVNVVSPFGNARVVVASPANADQQIYRIDQNFGSKNRIYGHYAQYIWGNIAAGASLSTDEAFQSKTHQVGITWTRTFSPTVVNDLRFGFLRAVANKLSTEYNHPTAEQIATLGFNNVWPGNLPGVGLPSIGVTGVYAGGGGYNTPWYNNQPTFDISNSTSIVRGTHTLSFGAGIRPWRLFNNVTTGILGQWSFLPQWTGNAMADFLLGDFEDVWGTSPGPKSGTTPGNPVDVHYLILAPFVEDDWKVTRKLTLNLGLRYDWSSVPYEADNKWSWFNPNIP
jgi:hypothetical protein